MKIIRRIIMVTYYIDKISSPVLDDSVLRKRGTSIFIFRV